MLELGTCLTPARQLDTLTCCRARRANFLIQAAVFDFVGGPQCGYRDVDVFRQVEPPAVDLHATQSS